MLILVVMLGVAIFMSPLAVAYALALNYLVLRAFSARGCETNMGVIWTSGTFNCLWLGIVSGQGILMMILSFNLVCFIYWWYYRSYYYDKCFSWFFPYGVVNFFSGKEVDESEFEYASDFAHSLWTLNFAVAGCSPLICLGVL